MTGIGEINSLVGGKKSVVLGGINNRGMFCYLGLV